MSVLPFAYNSAWRNFLNSSFTFVKSVSSCVLFVVIVIITGFVLTWNKLKSFWQVIFFYKDITNIRCRGLTDSNVRSARVSFQRESSDISSPCRVGSVGSVSASRTIGREFASRPGHTKDHHKNGTNCLPA